MTCQRNMTAMYVKLMFKRLFDLLSVIGEVLFLVFCRIIFQSVCTAVALAALVSGAVSRGHQHLIAITTNIGVTADARPGAFFMSTT